MADADYDDYDSHAESGRRPRRSMAGRKLMRWNPDVDQYLLLAVEIACVEAGNPIPWDLVAGKLNNFVTGEGIKQHLAKVRKYRQENGRKVPQKGDHKGASDNKGKDRRGEGGIPVATGKGAALLWNDPRWTAGTEQQAKAAPSKLLPQRGPTAQGGQQQKPRSSKKKAGRGEQAPVTPKTPAQKSRRSTGGANHGEQQTGTANKKSTGKRGRGKKDPVIKEEVDDDYIVNDSPTKKQRTLRATYKVDYTEPQGIDELNEDVYDASVQGDEGDGDWQDDYYYTSQANTAMHSAAGSSRASQQGDNTPTQPPPMFGGLLPPHPGTSAYGNEDYVGGGLDPSFGAGFDYDHGATHYGSLHNSGLHNNEAGQGNHPSGDAQPTADQMQMYGAAEGYGGYWQPDPSVDEVRRSRNAHDGGDDRYDPLPPPSKGKKYGKKEKKKHDPEKPAKTVLPRDKVRHDSVHDTDAGTWQASGSSADVSTWTPSANSGNASTWTPSGNSTDDGFYGEIPIANFTGRGINAMHYNGMPNLNTHPDTPVPDVQYISGSPDRNFGGNLGPFTPRAMASYPKPDTGITPQFNKFSFPTNIGDFGTYGPPAPTGTMPGGGVYNSFDGSVTSGLTSANTSFSSSDANLGLDSMGDQMLGGYSGGGDGAGLGISDTWAPDASGGLHATGAGVSTDVDMGSGAKNEPDYLFDFVDPEAYH